MSTYGDVQGVSEGDHFKNRKEVKEAGIHAHNEAGISGKAQEGANAIVLSGGYEDDEDNGDEIIYTGSGRDRQSGKQIADQKLELYNQALVTSELRGLPVRVIRGSKLKSPYSPHSGYRYDGLYRVDSHWWEKGISGFQVIRFSLIKLGPDAPPIQPGKKGFRGGGKSPRKVTTSVTRVVRDTALSREIKKHYDYRCQVCGIRLQCDGGAYAEAAHIIPLGSPHDGPDEADNILCLCPNDHVIFDKGGFTIKDDYTFNGIDGALSIKPDHIVSLKSLRYHRSLFLGSN